MIFETPKDLCFQHTCLSFWGFFVFETLEDLTFSEVSDLSFQHPNIP